MSEIETTWKLLAKEEFETFLSSVENSFVLKLLFTGCVIDCCDEIIGLIAGNEIVGIVTLSLTGEQNSGEPTVVALFVHPNHRRKGYAKALSLAARDRCYERGFARVRIDALSGHLLDVFKAVLPQDALDRMDINEHSNITDVLSHMENKKSENQST